MYSMDLRQGLVIERCLMVHDVFHSSKISLWHSPHGWESMKAFEGIVRPLVVRAAWFRDSWRDARRWQVVES